MTSKRNRFYQIGFFVITFAFITLCAFMGITAIQKSMTLKLQFNSEPAVSCEFAIRQANSTLESDFALIFKNYGNSEIGDGTSLSGNTLIFESDKYDNFTGSAIDIKFTNKTTNCSAIKLSVLNVTVGGNTGYSVFIPQNGVQVIEDISCPAGEDVVFQMEYVAEITFNLSYAQVSSVNGLTLKSSSTYYAVYGTTPSATLTATQNHMNPPQGVEIPNNLCSYSNGIINFEPISQDVSITVANTSMQTYAVVKELTKADVSYATTPTYGQDFKFTVTIDEDCTQVKVSYKIGNGEYVTLDNPEPSGKTYTYTISSVNIIEAVTINAVAISGYTITFNANGGSFSQDAQSTFEGQKILPTANVPIPTRDGYTFAGYYKTENTFAAETIPSVDLRYYTYDYFGNSGITPENKELIADTEFYARWLPFTIGSYVNATDGTIGELVGETTDVHFPAFEGYKYIKFKDVDTYGDTGIPLRFIIIGAGANVNSALKEAFEKTEMTTYAFAGDLVYQDPEGENKIQQGNNSELGVNQVLLLSEQRITESVFAPSGVKLTEWKNSVIQPLLNGAGEGQFLNETQTGLLSTYLNTYIPKANLNTAYYTYDTKTYNNSNDTDSFIFLLGSKYGPSPMFGGIGELASQGASMGSTATHDNTIKQLYYEQNFLIEDYLGSQDNVDGIEVDGQKFYGGDYIIGSATKFNEGSTSWLRTGGNFVGCSVCTVYNGTVQFTQTGVVSSNSRGVRPCFVLNLA